MKAIIVDIDGTLANIEHRRHFVTQEKPDWKSFYAAMVMDTPNDWCVDLVHRYRKDHRIIFVSGRPSGYQFTTNRFLRYCGFVFGEYDLYMRAEGDSRSDFIVKKEIYDLFIKGQWEITLCVDDRQQVVDMWREQGLLCLQCHKGDF